MFIELVNQVSKRYLYEAADSVTHLTYQHLYERIWGIFMIKLNKIHGRIYKKCLKTTLERLDKHFVTFIRVCEKARFGIYPFPTHDFSQLTYCGYKFELEKDPEDLFDIVYYVNMIITENRLASPFERCLEQNDIKFDYHNSEEKVKLLKDLNDLIEHKYKIKPEVILHNQYIIYKIRIIKHVKTERIYLDSADNLVFF